MSASYISTEDPQEPSQVADPVLLPASIAGGGQGVESLKPFVDLPGSFDSLETLTVLHQYQNFFVVAPFSANGHSKSSLATGIMPQEKERDGEVKATTQTLTLALDVPADAETLLNATTDIDTNSDTTVVIPNKSSLFSGVATWLKGDVQRVVTGDLGTTARTKSRAVEVAIPAWVEITFVTIGLIVSLAAHMINMFNFPRYELDEGTYMSSAWAIMNGMITPYAYGYGHPPFAWIQIAGWVELTGGFFTFGDGLNTGRVLMLFYALGCSLLIYLIVRQMSGSRSASLLALVLFSLSPLSIVYQRQVLLDNIAIFWLMLSLYFIVASKSRIPYMVLSGIALGISFLSKETFVLCMPAMIYLIWLYTTRYQHKFALVTFTYTIVALGSSFVLMAILKGELFPYSWHLPWDHHAHLSMLDTFVQQAQRTQSEGRLVDSWFTWTHQDPILMDLSIIAVAFNLLTGWWDRQRLFLSLLAISYWILIVRGGVVLSFYIIPLIPLVVLNAVMGANSIMVWIGKLVHFNLVPVFLCLAIIGVAIPYDLQYAEIAFTQHPTSAQTEAMVWVRNNVPRNDMVVINSYLYMDLRESGGEGVGNGATFPNAQVYWNVAYDPELHDKLLQGNWDRIDYIVTDSEMLHDVTTVGGPMELIHTALKHSILRTEFRADDHDKQIVISIYQVMHPQVPPTI